MNDKPTTGKVTAKSYQCTKCGAIETHSTNHYGDIYCKCRKCGWKHPMEFGGHFICLEPCPENMDKPEPWKTVKLGDILKFA